jgi:arylsulfatase A-like enzyme
VTDRQKQPNILFVISDQERDWGWLPPVVRLPWRERLAAEGLTLGHHYTHSAPCSPSRTTMQTGLHVPEHGVADNTVFPWHTSLDTSVPTIGSVLRDAGYRSS